MAWIESNQELARHPKTKRLARTLGIPVPAVIGHLHLLWYWALDFAPSGSLSDYTAADLADAMMWEDNPDELLAAMGSAGFLDVVMGEESGPKIHIHDWHDYAGKLLERRASDRERKRSGKGFQTESGGTRKDSDGNTLESGGTRTDSSVTVPIQYLNNTEPKDKDIKTSCPEPSPSGDTPDMPDEAAVITLTLNDKTEYPIFEEQVIEWADLYPAVDVIQQLRSMKGWLNGNPGRRKTKSGILRYVNGWLAKEQNKGGHAPPRSQGNGLEGRYMPPQPQPPPLVVNYDVEEALRAAEEAAEAERSAWNAVV